MSSRKAAFSAGQLLTVLLISLVAAIAIRHFTSTGQQELVESRRSVPVLGTYATLIVISPEHASTAILGSMDSLARVLDTEVGFFGTGELSRLNSTGSAAMSDLSDHLMHILERSLLMAQVTDSLFDPVMGNIMDAWGFPDDPALPDTSLLQEALDASTLCNLRISGDSLHLLSGARLDFGAIAKGYVVDRLFELAFERGASAALVEIGGEVRCGSTDEVDRTWRVALRDPRADTFREILSIETGSIATSGDYEAFLMHDGERLCHIIDPRTGYPRFGVASVTVVADDCETADALATAIAVGGIPLAERIPDSLCRSILVILEEEDGSLTEWSRGTH